MLYMKLLCSLCNFIEGVLYTACENKNTEIIKLLLDEYHEYIDRAFFAECQNKLTLIEESFSSNYGIPLYGDFWSFQAKISHQKH